MATGHLLSGIIFLELLELATARQHLEKALVLAKECGSLFLLGDATAFLASACIARGEYARAELELAWVYPDKALAIIDRLISTAAHVEEGEVIPRLWLLRGKILVKLGRREEAQAALCSARDAAQRHGARPLLWRICAPLGKLYRTGSQREQAKEALEG